MYFGLWRPDYSLKIYRNISTYFQIFSAIFLTKFNHQAKIFKNEKEK